MLASIYKNGLRKLCCVSPTWIRCLVCLYDLTLIPIAWLLAYGLRFNLGLISPLFLKQAFHFLPIIFLVQGFYYGIFGLYRGVWHFASLSDLARIIKVVLAGSFSCLFIFFLMDALNSIPRSIFPLYALLLIMLLSGSRIVYRWFKNVISVPYSLQQKQRVLVVGAGQAGESIVRDIVRDAHHPYQVVALIDDDATKQGCEIHGIRVLGKTDAIPEIVSQQRIDLIILAMPSAGSVAMRRIMHFCERAEKPVRTLPSIRDLTNGHAKLNALRAVSLEDLLGRDAITLDSDPIRMHVEKKIVLVSGGGGSIGAELCRQLAKLNPKALVVVEQNEFNLYALRLELERMYPHLHFMGYLQDVTDAVGIHAIFHQQDIDIVLHAAAYKHVPMLENQLRVAVRNNILGTQVLADIAVKHGVKKFILISTDKAVNPTNVMGATKRVAEIFCQQYGLQAKTQFITVRFGNVLGSIGSVVPLFKKQIEAGGPITITHPDITRFFMTIPEATQLILQAAAMGNGGEIFVLDMGEPIKIQYLAERMMHLAGLKEMPIQYIGLRPGEKLYEELFHEAEPPEKTAHPKILQSRYRLLDWTAWMPIFISLREICDMSDEKKLVICLQQLVPEFVFSESEFETAAPSHLPK